LDKFICEQCGACCRNLDKSILFAELDKGDGVCRFFDDETNVCTIYDERPLLCNVDKAYAVYFEKHMSYDEYRMANTNACKTLRTLIDR